MTEEQQQPTPLAEDLQEQIKAIQALTATHNLLNHGTFQVKYFGQLEQSIAFIESLHQNLFAAALAHPQAHLVPSLHAVKEDGYVQS
jgi:hypothetical protein